VSDADLELTAPTTRPVAAQHEFDRERLARFLRERIGAFSDAVGVEQFAGGQSNPTYLVSVESPRARCCRRRTPSTASTGSCMRSLRAACRCRRCSRCATTRR
jgi:aminoglycoside phosphotransferase (APT) family kinase protein